MSIDDVFHVKYFSCRLLHFSLRDFYFFIIFFFWNIAETALRIYRQKRRDGAVLRFKDCESCKIVASNGLKHLIVKELTRDHRPDRDDEKFRVENAGGCVIEWSGVSRVNGRLAVSRAIGDIAYKK